MPSRSQSKKLNIQLAQQLEKAIEAADDSGTFESYLQLIGVVTTQFEACEMYLELVLRHLDKGTKVLPLVFDSINSRELRTQILGDFIADSEPRRVTKRYQRIVAAFELYKAYGKQRDEVAHSTFHTWKLDGREKLLLCPPSHIRKKFETAFPRYHYDVPKLKKLADGLAALKNELLSIGAEIGWQNSKRMYRSTQRSHARSA
jgi:hypothetical protein